MIATMVDVVYVSFSLFFFYSPFPSPFPEPQSQSQLLNTYEVLINGYVHTGIRILPKIRQSPRPEAEFGRCVISGAEGEFRGTGQAGGVFGGVMEFVSGVFFSSFFSFVGGEGKRMKADLVWEINRFTKGSGK